MLFLYKIAVSGALSSASSAICSAYSPIAALSSGSESSTRGVGAGFLDSIVAEIAAATFDDWTITAFLLSSASSALSASARALTTSSTNPI